jgi:Flp pilus assembly CpaE family ATPase
MFDTAAPRRHGATLSAVTTADLVIAVGAAEPLGLQRLLSGLQELKEVVPVGVPVRVVVTKVRDGAVGAKAGQRVRDALERYAGVQDVLLIPDDRATLDAAMLLGRSLTEHAPSSPACRPLTELATQLAAEAGLYRGPPGRAGAQPGQRRRRGLRRIRRRV